METATIATDLENLIGRYVYLPTDDSRIVVPIWNLSTWVPTAFDVTPYLYVNGPPASGKTRVIEVCSQLALNCQRADGMTVPAMFDAIENHGATLLFDEVDTMWSGNRSEERRHFLNSGYKRGGYMVRKQANAFVRFSTYGPKILAGIKNGFLPDTLTSRCVPIEMMPKDPGVKLKRFKETSFYREPGVDELLGRIHAWSQDPNTYDDLANVERGLEDLSSLSDRANEMTLPLRVIATHFGHGERMDSALTHIFREVGREPSMDERILGRIRKAFKGRTKISSDELCSELGPGYNGRQLGVLLERYGVSSKDIRFGSHTLKGFTNISDGESYEDHCNFAKAFASHLRPELHIVEEEGEEVAA